MNLKLVPVLFAMLIMLVACDNSKENDQEVQLSETPVEQQPGIRGPSGVKRPEREPLMGRLEEMKARFYETTDPQTAETVNLAIDEIRTKDIERNALTMDDQIPMFSLPDATGEEVKIADLLEEGPVVIIFYRGPWCPYCNLQLKEMQEYVPYMRDLGASLVAISPTLPDSSLSMKERLELDFHVLSDSGNVVATNFGLAYEMPKDYKKMLNKNQRFKKYYGNTTGELPITMTYVVDQEGRIRYNFGDSDYRMRAEPHEIMDILVDIQQQGSKQQHPALQ